MPDRIARLKRNTAGTSPETSSWPGRAEKREPPASTRDRILAAAERLFAEHGFASVSMPTIAKASGITAGAIYKHFDSKEDLFFEVVAHAVQSVAPPAAESAFDAATDLPRVAAAYTEHRLKLLRQLAVEVHSASAKHPKVRRLLRRSLEFRIGQLREGIGAAQRTGEIDPALDPAFLAGTAMVFILGLMHMETVVPHFVGNPQWRDFVQNRMAALLGVRA